MLATVSEFDLVQKLLGNAFYRDPVQQHDDLSHKFLDSHSVCCPWIARGFLTCETGVFGFVIPLRGILYIICTGNFCPCICD